MMHLHVDALTTKYDNFSDFGGHFEFWIGILELGGLYTLLSDTIVFLDPENMGIGIRMMHLGALKITL